MLINNSINSFESEGLGWIPDLTDERDFDLNDEEFVNSLREVNNLNYLDCIYSILDVLIKNSTINIDGREGQNINNCLDVIKEKTNTFDFVKVDVYNVLAQGSKDPKVRLLKNFLRYFYDTQRLFITNTEDQKDDQKKKGKTIAENSIISVIERLRAETNGKDEVKHKYRLDLSIKNLHPLVFLDLPEKNWEWLNSEDFDFVTTALVQGFQGWAVETWGPNKPILENVGIDGEVGFYTYTALRKWFSNPQKELFSEEHYIEVPFPATMPVEVLYVVCETLYQKLAERDSSSFSYEEENFKKRHSEEIESISQKYFILIEPVVSVITLISGPLGAYPKTLKTVIEVAVERFLCLLIEEIDCQGRKVDKCNEFSEISIFKNEAQLRGFQHSMRSSLKLPDQYFLGLEEEEVHRKHLKDIAVNAIKICWNRFEDRKEEGGFKENGFLSEIISCLMRVAGIKDDARNPNKTNPSIILEFQQAENHNLNVPDNLKKDYNSLTDELSQWFFPSYVVPRGIDLLRNFKYAEKESDNKQLNGHEALEGQERKNKRIFTRLPKIVDLSFWCSPVSHQGTIKSCSAQAGAALIEYFSQRYQRDDTLVSSRFLYKITRNLMQRTGDTGSSLRETMKAMVLFGIPPEQHWPYDEKKFDEEPTPFCYSFAQNYQALSYFRLDPPNISSDELFFRIKITLAAGFPCMFGFTLYASMYDEFNTQRGYIPYPGKKRRQSLSQPDKPIGGHAVVAVGYHDNKVIKHSNSTGNRLSNDYSIGAFLIRNSWGTDWGINGYGWLPYDYIKNGLTSDWWSLIRSEWLKSGKFGLGGAKSYGTGADTGQKTGSTTDTTESTGDTAASGSSGTN